MQKINIYSFIKQINKKVYYFNLKKKKIINTEEKGFKSN